MTRRPTPRRLLALATAALMSWPALGWSAPPKYIPGQVIVKYRSGASTSARASLRTQLGGPQLRDLKIINGELVRVTGMSVEKAIELAKRNPNVEYAEPDYEVKIDVLPNDSRFNELYGMHNTGQTGGTAGADIRAAEAWDVFTGNPNLKVGVIDTGVDYNHPDLAANIWTNPGEIPGNSIDDDANGYVDDVHGYDFANNDGDPFDDNGHGSHCSGTIAGVGNNGQGVAGVNWQCKIVGIKFLNAGGSGSTAGAIASVQYAVTVGVKLTSNSWGGGGADQSLLDAINAAGAANQLFICAAGNNGSNNDAIPFYPASYDAPNLIAVAATDHNDGIASFSNFGLTTVDVGAPGVDILSCQPGASYQLLSGTSMATPHVSGVAALVYGRYPAITNNVVKSRIMTFARPVASLAGKCVSGGVVNALLAISDPDSIPPGAVADLTAATPGSTTMGMTWTATGDDGSVGRATRTELRYSTAPITEGNFASATLAASPTPDPSGTAQGAEISGLAYSTTYYFAIKAFDEWDNAGAVSNVATETTLGAPAITTSSLSQVDLLTGQQATQNLTISNTGAGTLDFTISPQILFKAGFTPAPQRTYPVLNLGKNERDPRVGDPVVAGSGGPDAFGYRWIDSDDANGPAFSWVDISGVGTPIGLNGDDQTISGIPIGFNFPFYGNTFSSVNVCTNGWLSFTSSLTQYTNQGLPASGTTNPENLVAPLWDDLNFATGGQAYRYYDGSRFIVEWLNAPHYTGDGSAPGPYTFEVILYPNGEIRYQYLTVNAPLNSNTVGIQDATKTIGLQTVFNANYVHANLAVRIKPLAQWMTVAPSSGRIFAGNSTDVTVGYDANGLEGGVYNALVHVLSNAPTSPTDVPAALHVVGAPNVAASPGSTDFGLVYLGYPGNRNLVVSNTGTDNLVVSDIVSSDGALSASPTNFTLAPSGTQNVTLTYNPAAPGALSATLTVQSNDPDEPSKVVNAIGSANDAPDIQVSATSMGARLLENSTESQTLHINNLNPVSGAQLDFTISAGVFKAGAGVNTPPVAPALQLGKYDVDPRPGMPALAASGGPDAFGYGWKDSDEPGGPTFSWVDITGSGTLVNFSTGTRDDGNGPGIPIGFSFPFYGTSFTTVNVCTNGWLSFTSTATAYTNTPLPAASPNPENMIGPFWDDLDLRISGQAYTYYDGSRFIVEWAATPHFSTGGPYTFEAILYPSGKIVYQYLSMAAPTNSATIGIQNATRTTALQVVFNAAYLHDNMAIQIQRTPDWLSVAPGNGSLGGHLSTDLTITYNSAGLVPGTYLGNLHIGSNDPDEASIDIPVTLQVITPTGVESSLPTAFALAMASGNPAHGAARFSIALPQRTELDMRVYNVKGAVVRQLTHQPQEAGYHVIGWDGRDDRGKSVASGVYFVRMNAGTYNKTLRVTMMR